MEKMFFLERKSDVNMKLKAVLGPHAEIYEIRKFGKRPRTRYGVGVAAGVIRFASGGKPLQ